jgi:hypothetical protein
VIVDGTKKVRGVRSLNPHCLSHHPRQARIVDVRRHLDDRSLGRGRRNAIDGHRVAGQRRAAVDEQAVDSPRAAVAWSSHRLDLPQPIPEPVQRRAARVAQAGPRGGEGGGHPPAALVVEERPAGEYAFVDSSKTTGGDPAAHIQARVAERFDLGQARAIPLALK